MKKENEFLAKTKEFFGIYSTKDAGIKKELIELSKKILDAHSLETNSFIYEDAFGTEEVKDARFLVFFSSEWENIEQVVHLYHKTKRYYGHYPIILFVNDDADILPQSHQDFMNLLTEKVLKKLFVMTSRIICSSYSSELNFIVDRVGNERAIMIMGARKLHYVNQLAFHFKKCPNKGKLSQYYFCITDQNEDAFCQNYNNVDKMSFLKDINKIAMFAMSKSSTKYAIDFVNQYQNLKKEFSSLELNICLWNKRQSLKVSSQLIVLENLHKIKKNY